MERFPALRKLSLRELSLLMNRMPKAPEPHARLIEYSQSAGRHVANDLKTIMPKGKVMHSERVYPLLGFEKLRLQGLFIGEELETALSDSLLSDCAGNAFDTLCCMATFITAMCALGASPAHAADGAAPADPGNDNEDAFSNVDASDDDDDAYRNLLLGRS